MPRSSTSRTVRHALRNPYCTAEAIEQVAGEERLLSFYEVRRDLTLHPADAGDAGRPLRADPLLARPDGCSSLDSRLRPALRRAAETHLAARLPGMAVGEKISLARRASPGVIAQLRHDPSPRVIAALLDNPRLTEGALGPVVHAVEDAARDPRADRGRPPLGSALPSAPGAGAQPGDAAADRLAPPGDAAQGGPPAARRRPAAGRSRCAAGRESCWE